MTAHIFEPSPAIEALRGGIYAAISNRPSRAIKAVQALPRFCPADGNLVTLSKRNLIPPCARFVR